MPQHELYMQRCLQLAALGQGYVSPNPMVGSVLVYDNCIIGEGYHNVYGQAHAEVNCFASVLHQDKELIPRSTLYVSLEPCAHHGKTPPCADRIIAEGVRTVVVGCRDPFEQVDGKGIQNLEQAGVEVLVGVLEQDCKQLNRRFFTFHTKHRPYIVLKWAETANAMMGETGKRTSISNELSRRFVHQLRASEAAILVGTTTAMVDNPKLDARYAAGPDPIRLIIDLENKLPPTLQVFDNSQRTIIFNCFTNRAQDQTEWVIVERQNMVQQVLSFCYQQNIQSILVEGGSKTLQAFINEEIWDEAIVIRNPAMHVDHGVPAPRLKNCTITAKQLLAGDEITYMKHSLQ